VLQGKSAHREFAEAMNATGRPMYLEVRSNFNFNFNFSFKNPVCGSCSK
jgi:hypothetical protein